MELSCPEGKQTRIEAINKDVVHQICSGQVVLNLAAAVKELVENSLDAGATVIEVRMKEYGSELVEVIDNGAGVVEENFQALTLKHHTSKLKEFSDLVSVKTFGFRGEALSSLCSLSEMAVVTRHSSSSRGTKLEFDCRGQIIKKQPCARQVGTTVSLQNLFSSLPVRQKKFHRNLRREFAKMTQLLYAYCLACVGIKISCTNQTKKGGRMLVVSTQGSETVRDNIACIFGSKQVQSLMEFLQKKPGETVLQEYGICERSASTEYPFHLEGCISSCVHGQGRSASDRQFFYVNSRPCEPTKVIKIINEVYHQFNQHQYPFVFLNLKMASNIVDVNVTPDKRKVFMDHEKLLIATIKASLLHLYKTIPSTFNFQNISPSSVPCSLPSLKATAAGSLEDMFKQWSHSPVYNRPESPTLVQKKGVKRPLGPTRKERSGKSKCEGGDTEHNVKYADHDVTTDKCKQIKKNRIFITDEEINQESVEGSVMTTENSGGIEEADVIDIMKMNSQPCDTELSNGNMATSVVVRFDDEKIDELSQKTAYMSVSIESIKRKIEEQKKHNTSRSKHQASVRFRAEIEPAKNRSAELELRKEISQDMFAKMEILGQFNLGFIITRLGSDLFIIDQHATDEKYNFEMLQLNTVLKTQRLVKPQKLELTAVNESILIENEEIFNKNGFGFIIDEKAESTKRVQLTSIPVSKNWQFGKEDIDELLFMLQDAPHTICRPSRVRAMFASRACRKSVMIGTALSKADMRRLIDHMGEIEQPWNCPHGRPTIRHLMNLDLIHNG